MILTLAHRSSRSAKTAPLYSVTRSLPQVATVISHQSSACLIRQSLKDPSCALRCALHRDLPHTTAFAAASKWDGGAQSSNISGCLLAHKSTSQGTQMCACMCTSAIRAHQQHWSRSKTTRAGMAIASEPSTTGLTREHNLDNFVFLQRFRATRSTAGSHGGVQYRGSGAVVLVQEICKQVVRTSLQHPCVSVLSKGAC